METPEAFPFPPPTAHEAVFFLPERKPVRKFPAINDELRPFVGTAQAAHYLDLADCTLRDWSRKGTGPIKPRKFGRKLLWSMNEIRRVLGLQEAA